MRFERIDLTRYGRFTDKSLDLGTATPGQPDLHLVFGPNEAGKSTLFSALLDLIFGIEHQSGYGFLHPYPTMRIGAVVDMGGKAQAVARVKRKQNTLIDAGDQPLSDAFFAPVLGALDRSTYQTMFSLDDDSIERGGEAILKSEGELGSLLFAASSGMPDASALIARLRGEAEAFYKPQGRKHRLAEIKAELDRLKAEKTALDLNARDYATLRKARDTAALRHGEAVLACANLRTALDLARAQLEGLPLLARLRSLRADLAQSATVPPVPEHWHASLPDMMRRETETVTRLANIESDIAERETQMAELDTDADILAIAGRIAEIERSDTEARYRTAVRDIPARLDERGRVSAEIALRRALLGVDPDVETESLILPPATIARMEGLIRSFGTLSERVQAARDEVARAGNATRLADEALEDIGLPQDKAADPAPLAARIRLLRQDDCLLRQTTAARQIAILESRLADSLAALSPFAGTIDALVRQAVPQAGDIDGWKRDRAAQGQRRDRLDERIAEETLAAATLRARATELGRQSGLTDDMAAEALRTERDGAWIVHRRQLDAGSAAAFEQALKRDDAATAARLSAAACLTELRDLTVSITESTARREVFAAQRVELHAEDARLDGTISAAVVACGLEPATTLPQFEDWLGRRRATLEIADLLRQARQDLALAEIDAARAHAALSGDMRAFDPGCRLPEGLDDALATADQHVATAQTLQSTATAARAAATQAHADHAARKRMLERVVEAEAEWRLQWADALSSTWLGKDGDLPEPDGVTGILAALRHIERLVQPGADLDHRIDSMRKDQRGFEAQVKTLLSACPLPSTEDDAPLAAFAALRERLRRAQDQQARRARLLAETERAHADRRNLIAGRSEHEAAKRQMLAHLGCETLLDATLMLDLARRQDALRLRIADAEGDLNRLLGTGQADAAEALLSVVDAESLRHEAALLTAKIADAEREAADLHAERREKDRALGLAGGDDAAAHIEEQRRTLLEDLVEKAKLYLAQKAGVLALEQALHLYRERHRSAMMRAASAAFSTISGGEYAGLSVQPERGQDILIANPAAGGSKLTRDLSKGTRFQLYLALRMAGYHEIAATRETLPFIADDIMETFDDNRAFHAFRLMSDMATCGQVIYLTHHEHLCAIARRACPSVTLHRL